MNSKKPHFDISNILNMIPEHVYWLDTNMVFLGCNLSQAKSIGLSSPEEIIGKTIYDFQSKDDAELIIENNKLVLKNKATIEFEEPSLLVDGSKGFFLSKKSPLFDDKGKVIGLIGISFNVTKLKESELEKAFLFEEIISHLPVHLYWKDKEGRYVGCNLQQARSLGYSNVHDIVGKTDFDVSKSKEEAEAFRRNDAEVMKTLEIKTIEEKAIFNDKDSVVLSQKAPLRNKKGRVVGVLGISMDITELKKTQKALADQIKETERAYHSKTEFLSTVTHEIRNPVGNVISYNEFLKKAVNELKGMLLKQDKTSKSAQKLLDKISENADIVGVEAIKALDYLKNLGELHRLEKVGLNPNFIPVVVSELIHGIIKNTEKYNIDDVEISTSIDSSLSDEIEIDFTNISEALQIIVSNAIRFNKKKGLVKIDVKNEKGFLKIIIQDTGSGMSSAQIDELFEDKTSAKRNSKDALYRKPSLRLTQAKMRVEASGGKLKIERIPKGTKVTVLVPYKKAVSSREGAIPEVELGKTLPFVKRNILVVEDDPLFQKVEKTIFEGLGHDVSIASTGADALKKLSKNTYDIVFLDISLPDMSGIDIMKKIRKDDKDLRIMVITSHANTEDIEHFEDMGATLVLTKPVAIEQFKECLEFFEDD